MLKFALGAVIVGSVVTVSVVAIGVTAVLVPVGLTLKLFADLAEGTGV